MKSHIAILLLALTLSGATGCSMCCSPYDFDYPTFGGKHERADRAYGRVGSIFSDPYAGYNGESADANLANDSPEKSRTDRSKTKSDAEAEKEIEKFKQELESIEPRKRMKLDGPKKEELPRPETLESDPTAKRTWQRHSAEWR